MPYIDQLQSGIADAPIASHPVASFDLSFDEDRGFVRTELRGFATLAQAEDYVAALAGMIASCRDRFGAARVLCEWRPNLVQPQIVSDRLAEAKETLFTERDRLALVVASSLLKSQARHRFVTIGSQAFLSCAAAELWLTAWS